MSRMGALRAGICQIVEAGAHTPHPGLGPDTPNPVGEGRDAPQVFKDVLFGDQPDGDVATVRVDDCRPEDSLCREASLRVVSQRPMPEVGQDEF